MSRYEPRWVRDAQPAAEEVTAATPAFVSSCLGDYDDGTLGCEAMIGELNVNYCRPRYEASSGKTARL